MKLLNNFQISGRNNRWIIFRVFIKASRGSLTMDECKDPFNKKIKEANDKRKKKKKRNLTNLEIARLIWSPVSKLDSSSVSKDLYGASGPLLPDNWIIRCSNRDNSIPMHLISWMYKNVNRSLYPILSIF